MSDTSIHAQRRARVIEALRAGGGGVAILPTAPERTRNADNLHPYRHDSAFYHLTGFVEPESWLVLTSSGHSLLFCRPRDADREVWDGYRLGPEAAREALGVDAARAVGELDAVMPALLANQAAVWFPFGGYDGLAARVGQWLDGVRAGAHLGWSVPAQQRDLLSVLDELRLVKDAHELALMRRAAEISADAHLRAMRFARAGLREYELEAELLHEFRRQGASGPAYGSIVAAGANACVLHYEAGAAQLRDGELCLIDAGCEYASYASDLTRTFPVNGRFSAEQRALYDLVLAAQQAAVECTRPGRRKTDAHWAAVRVLSEGLLDLGLLQRETHGGVDDVIDSAVYRRYFMHGTGHWLGLDVHDAGDYLSQHEEPIEQRDGYGGRKLMKPSRRLQPGMVLTIEPGLYVRAADDVHPRWWNIGIRIEDDAVLTATGCELITRGVPVRPEEIEALMRDAHRRAA